MTEYLSAEERKTHEEILLEAAGMYGDMSNAHKKEYDECFAALEKNGIGDVMAIIRLRALCKRTTLREIAEKAMVKADKEPE